MLEENLRGNHTGEQIPASMLLTPHSASGGLSCPAAGQRGSAKP